jgi:CheY-like chemotaxis protein
MRVVIVEDDYQQAELVTSWLRKAWPRIEVERIETELEFRKRLPALSARPPNVFIIDVMLRWADPSPDMEEPPSEILNEGFYRAGLRCVKLLRQDAGTSRVPVILQSALSASALTGLLEASPDVVFIEKESEPGRLIRLVGSLMATQISTRQSSSAKREEILRESCRTTSFMRYGVASCAGAGLQSRRGRARCGACRRGGRGAASLRA